MTREELVSEIIDLLEELPTVEMDTFDVTQFYWDEMASFWSSYYSKDLTTGKQLLIDGVWGDAILHRFQVQLERFRDLVASI